MRVRQQHRSRVIDVVLSFDRFPVRLSPTCWIACSSQPPVKPRVPQIGIRVALGARRAQVVGPAVRKVGVLSIVGLAIGLLGALGVTPIVGSLLIDVSPIDPQTLAAVSFLLATVALIATWLPTWHASAVDPMVALRDQ